MALNKALSTIRTLLKAELGNAADVTTADDTALDALLNAMQKTLCSEHEWKHLETRADVSIVASTVSYALPSINFDAGYTVEVKYNDLWQPVAYGIGPDEYNSYDTDETADPVLRWRLENDFTNLTVWPKPSAAQTLRFTGQLVPTELDGDAKTAVLDDLLLAFAVAAQETQKYGSKLAPLMAQKANQRFNTLRRKQPSKQDRIVFGGGGNIPVKPRMNYTTTN